MKAEDNVISDFNKLVNMSAPELETWLRSNASKSSGWLKDDGSDESVGHASGRKIVEILESNPNKEIEKYTDEDIEHMRKVVAYCKRHLAQETRLNNKKTPDEVRKTKSYASLKNWGHDFLRAQGKETSGRDKQAGTSNGRNEEKRGGDKSKNERLDSKEDNGVDESNNKGEGRAGTKRKPGDEELRPTKKRETNDSLDGNSSEESRLKNSDKVNWKWGGGHAEGEVLDIKGEE